MTDTASQNDETAPEPQVDISSLTPEQLVGHENGEVLPDGEKIVFEYASDGEFSGWHKEPAHG